MSVFRVKPQRETAEPVLQEQDNLAELRRRLGLVQQPEFQFLPPELLRVDMEYQRDGGPDKIEKISNELWVPSFGALVVFQRTDGSYYVPDGQHRLLAMLAAMQREPLIKQIIDEMGGVPCLVWRGMPRQFEVKTFRYCNTVRKNPTSQAVFRARLVEGEEKAHIIKGIVEKLGYRLDLTNRGEGYGIMSVAALDMIYDRKGADGLERVLNLIRQTWPNDFEAVRDRILRGVYIFDHYYHESYGEEPYYDPDHFVARMRPNSPGVLLREAGRVKEIFGGSAYTLIAKVLLRDYNKGLRKPLPDRIPDHPLRKLRGGKG